MSVEVFQIQDPVHGSVAKIAPQLGFNLFSFQPSVQGKTWEVLWQDPEFTTGNTRPSRSGIPLLFPFPGRLRGNQLTLDGKTFAFDVTDPLGNAIHGFVYTRPWRVVHLADSSITGEFQASVDDPSVLDRWPCDFCIRATYEISGGTLSGRYEISNPGNTILPWGFGTHPYFRLALGSPAGEKSVVAFPVTERWELSNMLPTGRRLPVAAAESYAAGVEVQNLQFDDVFTGLKTENGIFEGSVTDNAQQRRTRIRFSSAPFRECVVFIPPHREAICIEPYSCVSNAYELREQGIETGLQSLQPGQKMETVVEIIAEQI
jgi:aldose 1-epimerase